jgi:hypothetical protein
MYGSENEEGFVPLKFDYLRRVIPNRILKALKVALIDSGVISSDAHYIEGKKAIGYALGTAVEESPLIEVTLAEGEVASKIRELRSGKTRKLRLRVHKYLRNQLRDLRLDEAVVAKVLRKNRKNRYLPLSVASINNRVMEPVVCQYGRFHSPLTRLDRSLRPALVIKGKTLKEIDIANCQPLLLAALVSLVRFHCPSDLMDVSAFLQESPFFRDLLNHRSNSNNICKCKDSLSRVTTPQEIHSNSSGTVGSPAKHRHLHPDERVFLELCQKGLLYEHLMECSGAASRDDVKEQLFGILYGRIGMPSPLLKVMNGEFRHVMQVVRAAKQVDYRRLPRLMQRLESSIIINGVAQRVMVELPQAPLFTIHDSILTTEEFCLPIVAIMRQQFARIGVSPTVHVD